MVLKAYKLGRFGVAGRPVGDIRQSLAHGEAAGFAGLGFAMFLPLAMGGATLWALGFIVGVAIVRPLWRDEEAPAAAD